MDMRLLALATLPKMAVTVSFIHNDYIATRNVLEVCTFQPSFHGSYMPAVSRVHTPHATGGGASSTGAGLPVLSGGCDAGRTRCSAALAAYWSRFASL